MSFATEFENVFWSIFARGSKPRIRMIGNGYWECVSSDGTTGFGVTPRAAYGDWWSQSSTH